MDPVFVGGLVAGGGLVGVGAFAVALIRRIARLERALASKPETTAADVLAAAQTDARNRQLAILAAVDMADYVSQNFPGAGTEIIKRIAPHLLERRVE